MAARANEPYLERVATGFSFPTSLTLDEDGTLYLAEVVLPFGGARPGGCVWRLMPDGGRELLAEGLRPPVNGAMYPDGYVYVSEGGHPVRISRFDAAGRQTVLLENLPGPGNYHTNMVAFGPDGKLYFSQGATTNTGIVGLDAYEPGWLRRLPHAHDIPGYDVVLADTAVEPANSLSGAAGAHTRSGAFAPFGSVLEAGTRLPGQVPCTSVVLRCNPERQRPEAGGPGGAQRVRAGLQSYGLRPPAWS